MALPSHRKLLRFTADPALLISSRPIRFCRQLWKNYREKHHGEELVNEYEQLCLDL